MNRSHSVTLSALFIFVGLVAFVLGGLFLPWRNEAPRNAEPAAVAYEETRQGPPVFASASPSPGAQFPQNYYEEKRVAEDLRHAEALKRVYLKQEQAEKNRLLRGAPPLPSPTPTPVPAARANIQQTDRALSELESGNIAFTAPSSIQLEETGQVELLLSLSKTIQDLERELEQQETVVGAKIKVSDHMEASLSGAGFEIVPITPLRQAVSEKESTQWKWEVKAREPGRRRLHLSLNAVLSGEPSGRVRVLRTFDKDIEVTVTMRQRLGAFFTAHEFGSTLTAGIIVIALGWISAKLFERFVERKRKPAKGKLDVIPESQTAESPSRSTAKPE